MGLRPNRTGERLAMNRLPTTGNENLQQAKGIQRTRPLPDPTLGALWDSIILDAALKKQLLSQAILNFTLRRKVERAVLPLHGAILLVGQPGTGKTSLARGLAHRTAESFENGGFRLLEVEPHGPDELRNGQEPTRGNRAVLAVYRRSGSRRSDHRVAG